MWGKRYDITSCWPLCGNGRIGDEECRRCGGRVVSCAVPMYLVGYGRACLLFAVRFQCWAPGVSRCRGLWGMFMGYVRRKRGGGEVGSRVVSRHPDPTPPPAYIACGRETIHSFARKMVVTEFLGVWCCILLVFQLPGSF